MPSCWLNLHFLFVFYYVFSLFLTSIGWFCGVAVFGLIEGFHSQLALDSFLIIIIIIIIIITMILSLLF